MSQEESYLLFAALVGVAITGTVIYLLTEILKVLKQIRDKK